LRFRAPDGTTEEVNVLADTGNPLAVLLGPVLMTRLSYRPAPNVETNFGILRGDWVWLEMPELNLSVWTVAYGNEAILQFVQDSSPDFAGLARLPFLRLTEYGGDADTFWVRPLRSTPPPAPLAIAPP
jgi:hypothetical protein